MSPRKLYSPFKCQFGVSGRLGVSLVVWVCAKKPLGGFPPKFVGVFVYIITANLGWFFYAKIKITRLTTTQKLFVVSYFGKYFFCFRKMWFYYLMNATTPQISFSPCLDHNWISRKTQKNVLKKIFVTWGAKNKTFHSNLILDPLP